MRVFCCIDWASDHYDVAIVDDSGALPDARGHRDLRRLLVAALRAIGCLVYAINPRVVARYRDRHAVGRKQADHLDAMVLANILRTDVRAHRQLPADTELAQAISVLARAQLTSLLREYFRG